MFVNFFYSEWYFKHLGFFNNRLWVFFILKKYFSLVYNCYLVVKYLIHVFWKLVKKRYYKVDQVSMFCTENTLQLPCSITIYKKVFEPFETFFKTKYSRLITLTFSFYATFDLQSTWLEWFTVLNSRFIKIGIKKNIKTKQ